MAISEQHALDTGTVLGDYTIHGILGQGGFGITYVAQNRTLRQRVAIKEFLPSSIAFRDATRTVKIQSQEYDEIFRWGLDRFLEEARILANLTHPNIVRVLNFMRANGTGYMVMDYVGGQTLTDWADRWDGGVSQKALSDLATPLLDALATIHAKGITHRDIKPDNILITELGTLVLIDFGAARNSVAGKSQTMAAIVSAGYSPNEQYSTSTNQGPYTDIYSTAAMFYRLILGEDPPEAPLRVERTMAGQDDPCVRLAAAELDQYDPSFLQAIDWALNIRPGDRPQSIEEWRKSFEDTDSGRGRRAQTQPTPVRPAESRAADRADNAASDRAAAPSRPDAPETTLAPPSAAVTELHEPGEDGADFAAAQSGIPVKSAGRRTGFYALIAAIVLAVGAAIGYLSLGPDRDDAAGNSIEAAHDFGTLGATAKQFKDSVGGKDPADVFAFTLEAPADLRVRLAAAGTPPSLNLQDDQGKSLRLTATGAGSVAELDAGKFYLIAENDGGFQPYELEVAAQFFDGGPRPGRNINSAADLGALAIGPDARITRKGAIAPYRRDHYYTVAQAAPSLLEIKLERLAGQGELTLYDEARTVLRRIGSKDDVAAIGRDRLEAGRYTLRLERFGAAAYEYRLSLAAAPAADGATPSVRYARSVNEAAGFETARLLPDFTRNRLQPAVDLPGEAVSRYLEFRLDQPAQVRVEARSPRLSRFELFEKISAGRLKTQTVNNGFLDEAVDLPAGDYVMMLQAESGPAGNIAMTLSTGAPGTGSGAPGQTVDRPVDFGQLDARFTRLPLALAPGRAAGHFAFDLTGMARVVFEVAGADAAAAPANRFAVSLRKPGGAAEKAILLGGGQGAVLLNAGRYAATLRALDAIAADLPLSLGLSRVVSAGAGDDAPLPLSRTANLARPRLVVDAGATRRIEIDLGGELDIALRISGASEDLDLVLSQGGERIGASRVSGLAPEDLFRPAAAAARRLTLSIRNTGAWPSAFDLAAAARAARPDLSNQAREAQLLAALSLNPSRYTASGAAEKSADIATPEALHMAARAEARARAIAAATGANKTDAAPITTHDQWSAALTRLDAGIPFAESWTAEADGDKRRSAGLEAGIRVLENPGLIDGGIASERISVHDTIVFSATAGKVAVSLGVFAWFENETLVRLYPRPDAPQIDMTAGETLDFPLPGDPPLRSAPAPGSTSNLEAIVLTACRDRQDYRPLAPSAAETSNSSLVQAVSASSFLEALSTFCDSGLTVRVLPYVIGE